MIRGLAEVTGPYNSVGNNFDERRFENRNAFVYAHSGTRAGTLQGKNLGQRNSLYDTTSGRLDNKNFTNMADQVETTMGKCQPRIQDQAPAYGPSGAPNVYKSYPVLAQFENRQKWTEMFGSPFTENGPHKEGDGSSAHNQNQNQNQQPRQPILLGCNIVSSGEDQIAHRMTYLNRWFDEDNGEIMVQPPKTMQDKYLGSYTDELFKTPIDNTENKISTGIMVNPYTGEILETFEDQMPPPNTDKAILADRFEMVNPKLLGMQGGLDKNAPLPTKKEICLKVPGADFGPNVWGDQLYEDERRRRMAEVVNRELWSNRNGDYASPLGFAKEKPAGYVGEQQMYRALPYLPPVNELDNHGYIPVTSYQGPETTSIKSEVSVRKPDLTTCVYQQPAGPLNDNPAEYVVSQYTNRPTWRGGNDTYYAGVPFLPNQGTTAPQQTQNKSTLKEFMEQTFQPANTENATLASGSNGYVVTQTSNKSPLK